MTNIAFATEANISRDIADFVPPVCDDLNCDVRSRYSIASQAGRFSHQTGDGDVSFLTVDMARGPQVRSEVVAWLTSLHEPW